MLDNLMLQNVNNIIRKIKIVKTNTKYKEGLEKCIEESKQTGEELELVIVKNYMEENEYNLFKRYLDYKRAQNLKNVRKCYESLQGVIAQEKELDSLLEQGKTYTEENKSHVRKLNKKIEGLSSIILLNNLNELNKSTFDYNLLSNEYYSKISYFKQKIKKLKSKKTIFPFIKNYRINKTLESMNDYKKKTIHQLRSKDAKCETCRNDFDEYLEFFCKRELLADQDLYEAMIFILKNNILNKISEVDEKGVRRVSPDIKMDKDFILNETKDYIYDLITKFPDLDNFKDKLKSELTRIFQADIERIVDRNNSYSTEISAKLSEQEKIMKELSAYQSILPEPKSFTEDEEDTLSVVYFCDLKRKKIK